MERVPRRAAGERREGGAVIVRCAIVGLGRVASLLEEDPLREKPCTHAGAITANGSCTLVGGCDIRPDRCALFARRWSCGRTATRLEELLADTEPDLLVIATPPETHLDIAARAVEAGISFIICEKPLASTAADARSIARLHGQRGVRVMTNHERRYSADYGRVKRVIEARTYGELLSLSGRVFMGRRRPAAEILLEDGTHMVDILRFLSPARLELHHVERARGAHAESLLITAALGAIPVLLEVGSGRDHIVFEIELSFTSGSIRVGNGVYRESASRESTHYADLRSLYRTGARRPRVTGYFTRMIVDAVGCVEDPAREPVSSAVDGYEAVCFIESVLREVSGR
jgi:predicted dehydrogenase